MAVDVHPEAQDELEAAILRLARARRGYGQRLEAAYRTALRKIGETPQSFPPDEDAPDGFEVRYVHLPRYSYRVVFAVLGETVLVVAVAHDGREPGYWTPRLPDPTPPPDVPPVT